MNPTDFILSKHLWNIILSKTTMVSSLIMLPAFLKICINKCSIFFLWFDYWSAYNQIGLGQHLEEFVYRPLEWYHWLKHEVLQIGTLGTKYGILWYFSKDSEKHQPRNWFLSTSIDPNRKLLVVVVSLCGITNLLNMCVITFKAGVSVCWKLYFIITVLGAIGSYFCT